MSTRCWIVGKSLCQGKEEAECQYLYLFFTALGLWLEAEEDDKRLAVLFEVVLHAVPVLFLHLRLGTVSPRGD